MKTFLIGLLILLSAAGAIFAGVWFWKRSQGGQPAAQRNTSMPPVVDRDIHDLLNDLEAEIVKDNPAVEEALLPGITESALHAAEAELGAPLHPEMQALYRWHNGLEIGRELFPGYDFAPLETAIQTNRWLNAEYKKRGFQFFMAHEATWLSLFSDPAGDGYYYDPLKEYAEGGVFFNFREAGYFVYFPSFKNLIAALIDCYRQGAYRGTQTLDFDLEQTILETYGLAVGQ